MRGFAIGSVGPGAYPEAPGDRHSVGPNSQSNGRWWLWGLFILALVGLLMVLIAHVYLAVGSSFNSLVPGFDRIGEFVNDQSAAVAADQAVTVANTEGLHVGSLTPAVLDRHTSNVQWASPMNELLGGNTNTVGIAVSSSHVTTAVQGPIGCQYGLSVIAPTDPIITADHLPGIGTYWVLGFPDPHCAAVLAPSTGWQRMDPSLKGEASSWLGSSTTK